MKPTGPKPTEVGGRGLALAGVGSEAEEVGSEELDDAGNVADIGCEDCDVAFGIDEEACEDFGGAGGAISEDVEDCAEVDIGIGRAPAGALGVIPKSAVSDNPEAAAA